jgi:hypothetical protein
MIVFYLCTKEFEKPREECGLLKYEPGPGNLLFCDSE